LEAMMKPKFFALIVWALAGMTISGCLFLGTETVATPVNLTENIPITVTENTLTPLQPEPTSTQDIRQDIASNGALIFTCSDVVVRYDPGKKELVTLTNDITRYYSGINVLGNKIYFLRSTDPRPQESPWGLVYGGGGYGPEEVFRMNMDGSNFEQVTNNGFFSYILIASPAINKLIFVGDNKDEDIRYKMVLLDPETFEKEIITESNKNITSVYWSPNGKLVAFFKETFQLFLLDIHQEKSIELLPDAELSNKLAWSPDGQQLAIGLMKGDKPGLGFIDVKTGSLINIVPVSDKPTNFSWSPDGKKIIFETQRLADDKVISAKLWLLDLASQEIKFLHEGELPWKRYGYNAVWSPDSEYVAFFTDLPIPGEVNMKLNFRKVNTWDGFVSKLPCYQPDRALWITSP
jgi:hypothetical protein